MSEVKVNKITPTADCGTVTLGDSGDTVAIASGATLTSAGSITNSGTITNTGTISGGTISGNIDGQVNWQTTVKTTGFTATAGEGYFCNTTSAAFTVTLPASPSAGDIVGIKDYANTADTNNITIGRNGSNIQGTANDFIITTEGLSIVLLYVDSTKGWLSVGQAKASDISDDVFITATGGTVTTCGDYKIHTFTGPGTFCVTAGAGPVAVADYLVIAGGGSGGTNKGGGGGAGGYRFSDGTSTGCYSAGPSPLGAPNLPISAQAYPITVGAGGAGGAHPTYNDGSNSVFSTITSTGGGAGGDGPGGAGTGTPGGSGGGGVGGYGANPCGAAGGSGNTPSVSPPQGNDGGTGTPGSGSDDAGGGGGGASATGSNGGPGSNPGGDGGDGLANSINGSATTRAGGGGGAVRRGDGQPTGRTSGSGGAGGGGTGGGQPNPAANGTAGTTNTGSGGGGGGPQSGAGGSGIVIIRYKYQ
jgi:hypothetical protein